MPGVADEIEIRTLRDTDDIEAQADLADRAFGPRDPQTEASRRRMTEITIAAGANRAAFDGDRIVGTAVYYDMRQWWQGRPVPMAGVSGVKVAPEDRGRGIGKRLMTALLDDIADRGYPLSALYPATMPIYRSLGWEVAGARYTAEAPAWTLRTLAQPDLPVPDQTVPDQTVPDQSAPVIRRATPADAAAVTEAIGRVLERTGDCGPNTWGPAAAAARLGRRDRYAYFCDDGFAWYHWYDGNDGIFVGAVQGSTAAAVRALWSVIASHGTVAEKVRFATHPGDPIWQLATENAIEIKSTWHWMLRVVDAPAAIAARGYPPATRLDLPLIIVDQHRPANAGRWMLSVDGGKGELTRHAGRGDALSVGARGLAALYGGAAVRSLRVAGLAAGGDPAADLAIDAVFRCVPYLLDAF